MSEESSIEPQGVSCCQLSRATCVCPDEADVATVGVIWPPESLAYGSAIAIDMIVVWVLKHSLRLRCSASCSACGKISRNHPIYSIGQNPCQNKQISTSWTILPEAQHHYPCHYRISFLSLSLSHVTTRYEHVRDDLHVPTKGTVRWVF
jgi:hypothetical protein